MIDTKIMGILNATTDSFSDKDEFSDIANNSLQKFDQLSADGADIIDIGAQSTSYGKTQKSPAEEIQILSQILPNLPYATNVSIDTYNVETIEYALSQGILMINDISSARNQKILDIIKSYKQLTYFCMYSLVIPADKQVRVSSLQDVKDWFSITIKKLESAGIELDRVVLDPGIGFVSSPTLSLEIIKNVKILRSYGVKLMIGHSRKSYLEAITKLEPKDRDIETLAASCIMYGKVDYLRVHNVAMHKRSFEILKSITDINA